MFGTFSHRSEGEIWRHPNGAFCSMYDERFPFSRGGGGLGVDDISLCRVHLCNVFEGRLFPVVSRVDYNLVLFVYCFRALMF